MIIIIEGVDGSGKTMLAEQLQEQTGYKLIHRSKPESEEEKQQMLKMYIDLITAGEDVIFDRCWYSEIVYGQIMRDESHISMQQMYDLEVLVAKVGGIIIHCTGKIDTLWQRACLRGEDYITEYSTFVALMDYYEAVFKMHHKIPVVKYEYKKA